MFQSQKNDDDKLDRETDCDEEKHVVPYLIEENCIFEVTSNEEDRVTDLIALISSEHNLSNEVIQSIHEQQEDIFFQVGEKVSLDEFMIDDRKVMPKFHETFEVSFLMVNECNENLAVIS